jgi:hypothetical protein
MSTPGNLSAQNQPTLDSGTTADPGAVTNRPAPPPDNTNHAGADPNQTYTDIQAAQPSQVGQVANSFNNVEQR